jgi:iron complex outermembrane receptor protein
VENRTEAGETDAAATVQVESNSRLFGIETRLVAGVAAEYGRTRYESSVELARFDERRSAIGSGLLAQDSAVRLRSSRTNLAGFLSESLALAPTIALTVGGRFDHSRIALEDEIGVALDGDHRASRFNPTAGVTWEFGKSRVVFANYSEAFRAPTPVELTCADPEAPCRLPNAFVSDPTLRPVIARTVEAGVRGRDGPAEWSLAVFRTTTGNDLAFISNGASRGQGHFENVGATRRQGVELRVSESRAAWSWFLDYSYLDARFESAFLESSPDHPDAIGGTISVRPGDRIPSIPAHNLKAGARVRLSSRWSAGAQALFLSGQYLRGDEANLLAPLSSQLRLDVDASYGLGLHCLLFVRVTNVLGRHDVNFGQVASARPILAADDDRFVSPSAPRLVRAGVQVRF